MRTHPALTLFLGVLLAAAVPAWAAQAGGQGSAAAGKQANGAAGKNAAKRTRAPHAKTAAKAVGRGAGNTANLTAQCEPVGTASIETVMREMELAKQSNDPNQMRQALDQSETLMSEITDRMEHCNAAPGAYQQEMNQNPGGIIPNTPGGGTPGTAARGGSRQSDGPPENQTNGQGKWPEGNRTGMPPQKP